VGRIETDPNKRGSGKTVLVADDNPEIRRWVSQTFLSDGFSTCGEAENGQEAIDLAKQILPDLIILDLSMPVMNGLQAAIELRKLAPKTPIILFTMFGSDEVNALASKLGVDLVLSKVVALSSLLDQAHSLMSP
jgi:CheY-like chemotaxis protein